MFLEDKDYKVVCTDEVLDIITQSDPENRIRAELSAQEEAEGYLRSRYDTCRAFAQQGADRNPMLVRVVISIALYYLGQSLPQYMGGRTARGNVQQRYRMAQGRAERKGHARPAAL